MSLDLRLQTPGSLKGIAPIANDESVTPDSDELTQFCAKFEEHMPSSKKPTSHDSTAALLLSFHTEAGDTKNIDVKDEVKELETVFRDDYNFVVENKVIGRDRSGLETLQHLANFTYKHDKNHALLIVYYAGHAWRSNDHRRILAGGFDLAADGISRQTSSNDSIVMWENSETILHQAKCDVLVIFDCCDAGSLNYLRSRGRAFEYLGACERGKYTKPPGPNSFTSAMIWALRKLKTEKAFTTATLRDTIRTYDLFPNKQEPVLFTRREYLPEHVWISPMRVGATPVARPRGSSPPLEFRDEDCSFVEVRLFFNKHLATEDAEDFADMMRPLVVDSNLALNARHVEVRDKSICHPRSPASVDLCHLESPTGVDMWRTAKVVHLAQRWLNKLNKLNKADMDAASDGSSRRKRRWRSDPELTQLLSVAQTTLASISEDDDSDAEQSNSSHSRKKPRHSETRIQKRIRTDKTLSVGQRPVTPISDGHGSEAETVYPSQVEMRVEPSFNAPVTLNPEHRNSAGAAMKDLESLERSILLNPKSDAYRMHIQALRALIEKDF